MYLAQFDAEIVEGEFVQGDAFAEIFEVEDLLAQPEQLLVAVTHVLMDEFLDFVGLENVVLKCGGDVHQRHARFDAVLEIDVFVEVLRRPKIHQLDGVVHAADTVNATEALDDADGIPVDVVIDEVITILKVLALGNAIRGDEQINLAVLRHGGNLVAVFGARGKVGEDLVVIRFCRKWCELPPPPVTSAM